MESVPEDKVVFGASSEGVESAKEQEVVDMLTKLEPSELYPFHRPRLRYRLVKEMGESRGWGTSLANGEIEGISKCPLTLAEALKTLNAEELAVFFVLFPDRLKAWKQKVYDAHTKLVADYRARVQQHHAEAKAAKKKAGGPGSLTAAFVDWEIGVEDDDDEVLCRSVSGDSDRDALVAELAEVRGQVVALTARLEHVTGSSDGGPGAQLSSMSPRLSESQKLGLRRLIANDVGDGVTEDDIVERAVELGVADLLE